MISGLAVVGFGVHLIWNGSITIGALVATMLIIWRILGPLQTMCSMLPRIEQLRNSISQINRLVNVEIERHPTVLKRPIEKLEGHVRLTNVGLRYSTEVEPIFVGLDIDVQAGEVIGITGVNGSGKSSLLKLINGLYKPQTGTIRIDDINIRQLEPIELRNYIAYLPQMPNFFEGTIKENLLLVNPLATDEEIDNALILATAMDEIEELEHGRDCDIWK
jgi:ABC-type bacteriocin/lantibiotic exporter with double-glycine peptidase domain